MKTFNYKLVTSNVAAQFELLINTALRDGWELHGELKVVMDSGFTRWSQSMIYTR